MSKLRKTMTERVHISPECPGIKTGHSRPSHQLGPFGQAHLINVFTVVGAAGIGIKQTSREVKQIAAVIVNLHKTRQNVSAGNIDQLQIS